jgi:Uma2 family endonuclease
MKFSDLDLNKTYSYADYLLWNFEERVELILGKIFKMSPGPRTAHQKVVTNLFREFAVFLKGKKCQVFVAPFDVRLPATKGSDNKQIITVVQPDICVVCDENKIDERGCLGAPDFIIEITSPYSASKDTVNKFNLYESAGVLEYWIVWPEEKTVQVYDLKEGSYQLRDNYEFEGKILVNVLPGLELDLKEIFA